MEEVIIDRQHFETLRAVQKILDLIVIDILSIAHTIPKSAKTALPIP